MNDLHKLSIERIIRNHQRRLEELRKDWVANKRFPGKQKFIETLGKLHKKEIVELQRKIDK